MPWWRVAKTSLLCALAWLCFLTCAAASPYHGQVTFGGLPLPGATITATRGDAKFTAVSDQGGVYAFADLPDGDWKIEVQGHTDSTGVDSHNLVLSQARAAAVADYLSHHGAVAAQLSAKGYGASRPIMPNDTETGRAQNRRVELVKSQ